MRSRLLVLFAAALVLTLGAVAFVCLRREREPEYEGRKLSYWSGYYSWHAGGAVGDSIARDIRLHFGTNALPWLIKWTLYEEPRWQSTLRPVLPDRLAVSLGFDSAFARRNQGVMGFWALGEMASPAISPLAAAANDPTRPRSSRISAMQALLYIGREAVPAVLSLVSSHQQDASFVAEAILNLRNFPQAGAELRQCLQSTNAMIASAAARSLGLLRLQPDLSIPMLSSRLDDPNWSVRSRSCSALAEFGPDAKAALPKLAPWLTNSDVQVRAAATNAFAKIAPQDK